MSIVLVNICGNLGSGKTTVSRALAKALGAHLLPETPYDTTYIRDIFLDPHRWALEAQLSFALTKASDLSMPDAHNRLIVVDRSFDEEIDVFASHFFENGFMDDRSYSTYLKATNFAKLDLPTPTLSVLCAPSLETCIERVGQRSREYQDLYPPNFVSQIGARHAQWWSTYSRSPKLAVDTERIDFRTEEAARRLSQIVDQIIGLVAPKHHATDLEVGFEDQPARTIKLPPPPAALDITELLIDVR